MVNRIRKNFVQSMKILCLTAGALLLTSCATSTIESRKTERAAAYTSLSPEMKTLVDQGQIKVGMTMDAVYIAWGPPAQILQQENQQESATVWLYHGGYMAETRYWSYRQSGHGRDVYLERFLQRDYDPVTYVSAEIVFVDGKVKQWRTLPAPG